MLHQDLYKIIKALKDHQNLIMLKEVYTINSRKL
jgi:hypothetical protein